MLNQYCGKIISFEGGEGCGKTTQINKLTQYFKESGYKVTQLREPGGSNIAEQIRDVILKEENSNMTSICESLCFAASRAQLMDEKIIPALNNNHVVILDRFVDSSYVYQGLCKGVGLEKVIQLNEIAIQGHLPYITFYIDIEPEIGFQRIIQNGRETNKYEMMDMEFHKQVREGYLKLCSLYSDRIYKIDGNDNIENIYNKIISVLLK